MNNYYTIKILLQEIHSRLLNSVFESAFSVNKNSLNICFLKDDNELRIVLNFDKGLTSCYMLEHGFDPKSNTAFFFDELKGLSLKNLTQLEGERVLVFEFSYKKFLYLSLFGSIPNAYLVEDNIVKEAFKQEKTKIGKSITSLFPAFSTITNEPLTPKQAVLSAEPKLPRQFIDELIHYAGPISALEDWKAKAAKWVEELETSPNPRLLVDHRFTLFSEKTLPIESKLEFEHVNDAIRRSWSIIVNEGRLKEEKDHWIIRLQQRLRYLEGLIEQASNRDKKEKQAETWQNWGHLLMSQPNPQQKVKQIHVFDYFESQQVIEIPLKEDLSLLENANRYYQRSSNSRKSLEILEKQAQAAKRQVDELQPLLLELAACTRYQHFVDWKKAHQAYLSSFSTQKETQQETDGFASFQIDGYDIWMGKSAKSNDILLQRAHKEDLWFHARGVGGSHVLVRMNKRKENPPKVFMEKIASLAAWHSQAKGSSLVPVQVTRRKFLRKPKGGDPGLVLVDKEEVFLVKPDRLQA
jgi:predicted ribosome quality control (RQC) complex YloA/Tae2 family protein